MHITCSIICLSELQSTTMASYKKNEQEKPLSIASPAIHLSNSSPSSKRHLRTHHVITCCVILTLILSLIILTLSLTLFKIKDPSLTMTSVSIQNFNLDLSLTQPNLISANLTLMSLILIRNPNIISFKFNQTITKFYYEQETVGVAHAPAGEAVAGKAAQINVTVDLLADRIITERNITHNILFNEELDLRSYTGVKGRVNLLGLYKKDLKVGLSCNITLGFLDFDVRVKSTTCMADEL